MTPPTSTTERPSNGHPNDPVSQPIPEEFDRFVRSHYERGPLRKAYERLHSIGRSAIRSTLGTIEDKSGKYSPEDAPPEDPTFFDMPGRVTDAIKKEEREIALRTGPKKGSREEVAETDATVDAREKRFYQDKPRKGDRDKRGKIAAFRRHKKIATAERREAIANNLLMSDRVPDKTSEILKQYEETMGSEAWATLTDEYKANLVKKELERTRYKVEVPSKHDVRETARNKRDYRAFLAARFTPRIYSRRNMENGRLLTARERYTAALREYKIGHAKWTLTPHDKDELFVDYVNFGYNPDPRAIASGQRLDEKGKPMFDGAGRAIYNDDARGLDQPSNLEVAKAQLIKALRTELAGVPAFRLEAEIQKQLKLAEVPLYHLFEDPKVVKELRQYEREQKDIAAHAERTREWLAREKLLDVLPRLDAIEEDLRHNIPSGRRAELRREVFEISRNLKAGGISLMDSMPGTAFDPNLHIALGTAHTDGDEDGPLTILKKVNSGYMWNGKVLVKAKVVTAHGQQTPEPTTEPEIDTASETVKLRKRTQRGGDPNRPSRERGKNHLRLVTDDETEQVESRGKEEQEKFEAAQEKLREVLHDLDRLDAESRTSGLTPERRRDISDELKAYQDRLKTIGIETIDPPIGADTAFDPNRHEALSTIGDGDNYVVDTLHRLGYTWRGRTLRPALVTVRAK